MTGRGSRIRPDAPGYWTSTPHSVARRAGRRSRSATTTSMPIASARVRTTSMVCGRASASTTNGPVALRLRAAYQRHRLGGRGALVEQAGVGGGQPGQVADHGLEVEQRLEAALGDLGLVRRVRGVPARVLEHVAPDHRRRDRARGSRARSSTRPAGSARRAGAARARRRTPRAASGRSSVARRDAAGHRRGHQVVERVEADAARACGRRRRGAGRCGGRRRRASAGGVVGHGWLLGLDRQIRLPLCRRRVPVLQSCLTRTVLAPERFRGGVAPSALRSRRCDRPGRRLSRAGSSARPL